MSAKDLRSQLDGLFSDLTEPPVVEESKPAPAAPRGPSAPSVPDDVLRECRRLEQALQESEARFQIFLDEMPVGYHEIDAEGRITRVNRTELEMLGYTAEEMLGHPVWEFITAYPQGAFGTTGRPGTEHEDSPLKGSENRQATMAQLAGQLPLRTVEHACLRKDGNSMPALIQDRYLLDAHGQIQGIHTVIQDITERKQAEEALRESEEKYRTILDNIEDGYYEADIAGNLTFFNDSLCKLYGYSKDELMGMNYRQYMDAGTAKTVYQAFNTVYRTGKPTKAFDWEIIRKDSTRMFVQVSVSLMRGPSGEPVGFQGVLRDITERKAAEAERERLLAELERRALQLQTAAEVSRVASSILNLDELLPQVAELIREHYGLYYVGLFLTDDAQQYAVLRAGTGEAGRKMLETGHKLEVGGTSMIGWCIANRQARIALDVGAEAVRFASPLLPLTRSETALPLISRGQVIGGMTIQSDRPSAFSQDDITALQTMADQVASAIENARLFTERKQTEEALQESEESFRALADNANDGFMIAVGKGAHVYANRRLAEITGYSVPELLKTTMADLVHPNQLKEVMERFQKRLEGKPAPRQYEVVFVRKDGQSIPLELTSAKTVWHGQPATIVALRDITERKRAEATLENRALQLQTAAEVSRAASSILNLDELLPQVVNLIRDRFGLYYVGLFLLDQEARYAVLQAGTGEAGRQMMAQGHKLEVGGASMIGWCVANRQARIALDVGAEAVRFDNPFLPATHSELALPLVSRGQIIGALTVQSDQEAAFSHEDITVLQTMADQMANAIENARLFTERKQAGEALAQEQYLMQALMDNTPDYIYFKDRESRFIRTTRAHAKAFGLSDPEEAVGKTDFDFFTEEHARPAYEDEQQIIRTGRSVSKEERETWLDRPDTWVMTTKMPLRDKEGRIIGTFGISRDITERKLVEQALAYEQYLLNSLLDNVPYRIYFKDAESRYIRVNRAWTRLYNLDDPAQALGKTDFDFLPKENAQTTLADEQVVIGTGQPLVDKESRRKWPDGRETWSSTTKLPLRDKGGQVVGTFGISRDITERKVAEAEREQLLTELERRARQLQTATQVSRAASSILNLDELAQQAVNLIRDRFNLYYVGLFLVDEAQRYAVLLAGTGEAGQKMLQAGHKLPVGGSSMIGGCIAHGEARIALDVGKEAVRFENPLLPQTRSEVALPLISRGRVFGAMTIQSDQPAAFTQEDITVLQAMADQLANAIENARLFEQTSAARQQAEARVREMQILQGVIQAASSTLDLERVLDALFDVLEREMGFTFIVLSLIDESANELRTARAAGLAQGMNGLVRPLSQLQNDIVVDVARKGQIEVIDGWDDRFDRVVFEREGHAALVRAFVPLRLQDEPIGALEVGYLRQERAVITPEEVRLLGSLAGQVAVAVKNARLFEQTRAALAEAEATQRRYLGEQWKAYVTSAAKRSTGFVVGPTGPTPASDVWLPEMEQALTRGALVSLPALPPDGESPSLGGLRPDGDQATARAALAAPIKLRGHPIGVLDLYVEGAPRIWSQDEQALVEAVADQIALALENARLFEQTQQRAERERLINEVTARIRSAVTMEAVLNSAIREVSQLTDASYAAIKLELADAA